MSIRTASQWFVDRATQLWKAMAMKVREIYKTVVGYGQEYNRHKRKPPLVYNGEEITYRGKNLTFGDPQ